MRWSPWGERLVGFSAIAAAVSLAHAWVLQYANPEGNAQLGARISGPVIDPMPIPPDTPALQPLLGLHYFGDLQLAVAYGVTSNPYTIDYPAQYPPIGIWEFRLLGILGYQASLWLFLLLTVGLLGFVGWRLMGGLTWPRKAVALLVLMILTPAMIMAVDRGALSPIATGLVGLAFLAARRRTWWLSAILLILAISLKPYLVLVLLYPLLRGHWRFALATGAATAAANLVAFATFPGGFLPSLTGFLDATLRYADSTSDASQAITVKFVTLDAVSLTGTGLRLIALMRNIDVASMVYDDYARLAILPGLLFIGVVVLVLLSRRAPFWVPLTLVLATATAVFPATPLYTLSWATLAAFYFGSDEADPFPGPDRGTMTDGAVSVLRWTFLTALVLCLAPTFWLIPNADRGYQDAAGLLGPSAVAVATAVTLVVVAVEAWRHRGQPQPATAGSPSA